MALPWYQLKGNRIGDDPSPSPMTFPALIARRYSIISCQDSFVLSENDAVGKISIYVVVDETSQVKLEADADAAISVSINDREIEKGKSATLSVNDRIKLADRIYVLNRIQSDIADLREKAKELILCPMCRQFCDDPRLLKCSHTMCNSCLGEKIRAALNSTGDDVIVDPAVAAAIGGDRDELLQQMRTISCAVCKRKFSVWEASKCVRPLAQAETMRQMREWTDYDGTMPKCAVCEGVRCLVDLRDYEYCETCDKLLCPVCAVEGHRFHEFRTRAAIVRGMHEYVKSLAVKKFEMENLRKKEAALKEKTRRMITEFYDQGQNMSSALRTTAQNCKKSMADFEEKANPFNDAGLEVFSRFNAQTKEGEKEIEKLDVVVNRLVAGLNEMKTELKIDDPQDAEV